MPAGSDPILLADTLLTQYFETIRRLERCAREDRQEGVRLQIAEAKRLYPTIWEHLDQARLAASGLGRDTSGYDEFREQSRGDAHQAVADMEELSLTFSLKEQLHKEVALDGAILARHASAALKKSFPEVDWDGSRALAGETEVDLTAGRKRALLIVSLLFLVAASVTIYLYPDSVYVFVAGAIAILYAWIRVRSMGLR